MWRNLDWFNTALAVHEIDVCIPTASEQTLQMSSVHVEASKPKTQQSGFMYLFIAFKPQYPTQHQRSANTE